MNDTPVSDMPVIPPPEGPRPPEGGGTRALWVGLLTIGLLMVAIALALNVRSSILQAAAVPTATLVPDIPGVLPIEPPRELTDFSLPATTGGNLQLSDLRGRWVLMFFGFTHCPDFCPLTLGKFKQIQSTLESDGIGVPFSYVLVSVDPARDTPEVLQAYVSRFDPTFIGLSGDNDVLTGIAQDYGLFWELNTDEGPDYTVTHSTASYLIDPEGRLHSIYTFDAPINNMVQNIREAIRDED